jgi:hypothetical protein
MKIGRPRMGGEMSKLVTAVAAMSTLLIVAAASGGAASKSAAPTGLTSYGRTVWNLDALLHDTFGERAVYLSIPGKYPRVPRNFSTVDGPNCCSAYYLPTFRDASGSAFTTYGPTRPPRPNLGASGGEVPLTIRHAYIYCGGGKWLYEHYGNGPANWQISCHR